MNELRAQNRRMIIKSIVIPTVLTVAAVALLFFGAMSFANVAVEQDRELTLSAIKKTVVTCYSDEGRFPPSLDYLVENYGLFVDTDRYDIVYDCMASNIYPTIEVYAK